MTIIVLRKLFPVKCFCITFIVFLFVSQQVVRAAQSGNNTEQKSPAATSEPQQQPSVSVVSSPISQTATQPPNTPKETSTANNGPTPSNDSPKITDWLQTFVNAVLLFVIIVTACIYNKQRKLMQLQWRAMRLALIETRKMVRQNERAVSAMEIQANAAQVAAEAAARNTELAQQTALYSRIDTEQSLTETRKMVEQNARAVEASEAQAAASQASVKITEESVEIARKAFYVGERAYFGIKEMTIADMLAGRKPRIIITFMNGGRTPAWHFDAWFVGLSLSEQPSSEGIWNFKTTSDISNSFFPSDAEKRFWYEETNFVFTQEHIDAIEKHELRMFIIGTANYLDISGERQAFNFCGVYSTKNKCFMDWYT